jgi:mycothiol system anti-sigma-R factor
MTMIDCRTAVDRLYKYLDRELTSTEYEAVQQHLDRCPPCAKYFHFEEGVLRLVGDACRKTATPATLRKRVEELRTAQHNS